MKNKIDNFVETHMSDNDKIECIRNWEELEKHGKIGDCALRDYTKKFQWFAGIEEESHFILWMEKVAGACYKFFAYRFFFQHDIYIEVLSSRSSVG